MINVSRTELTIVDHARNLQKDINRDLKDKNARDMKIHSEVENTQFNHFRLLENNYLNLQKEYDDLMKKYLDLELKYHNLESDKSLTNHEKLRLIEKQGRQLADYKIENHALSVENQQL